MEDETEGVADAEATVLTLYRIGAADQPRADDGAADPQHDRPVPPHHRLERLRRTSEQPVRALLQVEQEALAR